MSKFKLRANEAVASNFKLETKLILKYDRRQVKKFKS
jgi:hypothetical protein